jgi:phosphatidylglycerol lysyltransferase
MPSSPDVTRQPNLRASGHRLTSIALSRLLWLGLGVLVTAGTVTHLGELRAILQQLRQARSEYIVAAVAIQGLFVLNLARFFVTAFRATGLRARTPRFVLLTSASYLINLVSKTSGLGGLTIYVREAMRNKDPVGRVSAAYLVTYIFGYAVFYLALLLALAFLMVRGSLNAAEATAAGVIAVAGLTFALLLVAAMRSADAFEGFLLWMTRGVNRAARLVGRAELISSAMMRREAREIYGAIKDMRRHPGSFVAPLMHAVGVELLSALLLFVVARALHVNIDLEIAFVGYVLSLLFSMIAFTPAGIGLVEASLSVLLISFGVPQTKAIAVALTYRFFDFWLPVFIGVASLSVLKWQKLEQTALAE